MRDNIKLYFSLNIFILEENMRKDVKDYWQEWPCVIRHMLRYTKTQFLNYFADLSLCNVL